MFQVSIPSLERALHQYTLNPSEAPFDIKSVPLAAVVTEEPKAVPEGMITTRPEPKVTVTREETYAEKLQAVPELAVLGAPFHSSEPVELTESETEYVVCCIKHTFQDHLVFQVSYFCT